MYKEPSEKATLKKSLLGWDLLEEQKLIVQSWEFQAEGFTITLGRNFWNEAGMLLPVNF